MRQLQKLVARTDCGLGALERDLAALEATAQSSRQALNVKSTELAAAEARAADLERQLQQVSYFISVSTQTVSNCMQP